MQYFKSVLYRYKLTISDLEYQNILYEIWFAYKVLGCLNTWKSLTKRDILPLHFLSAPPLSPSSNPLLNIQLPCFLSCFFLFFFFWLPGILDVGILVPWPGIEPVPSAVDVGSLNRGTAREVSFPLFLFFLGLELRAASVDGRLTGRKPPWFIPLLLSSNERAPSQCSERLPLSLFIRFS